MRKYKIINVGCHDQTESIFELTKEQYEFLEGLFESLNENSDYECMPLIYIEDISRI